MDRLGPLVRVRSAEPLDDFRVLLTFENGVRKELDLRPYLRGPVFEPIWSNPEQFQAMHIEGGTVTWDNGADIDPDVLYYGLTPAWAETQTATQP